MLLYKGVTRIERKLATVNEYLFFMICVETERRVYYKYSSFSENPEPKIVKVQAWCEISDPK